jgi:hypothetical protein
MKDGDIDPGIPSIRIISGWLNTQCVSQAPIRGLSDNRGTSIYIHWVNSFFTACTQCKHVPYMAVGRKWCGERDTHRAFVMCRMSPVPIVTGNFHT